LPFPYVVAPGEECVFFNEKWGNAVVEDELVELVFGSVVVLYVPIENGWNIPFFSLMRMGGEDCDAGVNPARDEVGGSAF